MFLYSHWMSLPISTRIKIAAQFGIIKRGSTEVVNNVVKFDGYVIKEVEEALNIDAIQTYVGTQETDMMMLWMWLIEKIEGKVLSQPRIDTTISSPPQKQAEVAPLAEPQGGEKPKNKGGRPKKNG